MAAQPTMLPPRTIRRAGQLVAFLMEVVPKERYLHFELLDPVCEEENSRGCGVDIPRGAAFEVSPTGAPRESRPRQGGSNEQGERGIETHQTLPFWGLLQSIAE